MASLGESSLVDDVIDPINPLVPHLLESVNRDAPSSSVLSANMFAGTVDNYAVMLLFYDDLLVGTT